MEEQQLDASSPAQQYCCIFVVDDDDDDDYDEGWGDLRREAAHACAVVSSSDVGLISASSQSSSSALVWEEDASAVSNGSAMEKDCLRADPKPLTDSNISNRSSRTEITSSMSFNGASLSGNNFKETGFLESDPHHHLQSIAMIQEEKESTEAAIGCEIAMPDTDTFSDQDGNCSMMELLGLHFPQMQQEVSSGLLLTATTSKIRTSKLPIPESSDHNPVLQVLENTDFEASSWDVGVFKNFEGGFVRNSSRAASTRASGEICVTTAQWKDVDPRILSNTAQGAELPPPPDLTFNQMEAVIPPPVDLVYSKIHAEGSMGASISSVAEQKAGKAKVKARGLGSSLSLEGAQVDLEMAMKEKCISSVKYEEEIYAEGRKPEAVVGSKPHKSFQSSLIHAEPAESSLKAVRLSEGCVEHRSRSSTGRNIQKASIEAQEDHCSSKRLKRRISSTPSSKDATAIRISRDGELIPDQKKTRSNSRAATVPALNTNLKPRARQGSARDPQSIAARHRRERISRRLKILQELIPNGSKVDLVTMLEKAINYVKYLQLQAKVLMNDDYWPREQRLGLPPYILQAATSAMLRPYHVAANLHDHHHSHPLINYQRL